MVAAGDFRIRPQLFRRKAQQLDLQHVWQLISQLALMDGLQASRQKRVNHLTETNDYSRIAEIAGNETCRSFGVDLSIRLETREKGLLVFAVLGDLA